MNVRTDRFGWLKCLLAAGALVLAPLPAAAHGGHDHSPAAQPVSERTDTGQGRAAPAHSWSQSCPGAPGSPCCCSHQKASPGVAKPVIVNGGGWVVFLPPLAHTVPHSPDDAPRGLLPSSLVHPRAPPLFS